MKLKVFLLIIVVNLFFSNIFGQSCGGGTDYFYVFDETGINEITDYSITLEIIDENQLWKLDDLETIGWKLQVFDEEPKDAEKKSDYKKFTPAYEISEIEYQRLMKVRESVLQKNPKSFVGQKINRCNYRQPTLIERDKRFSVCTSEACNLKVVAKIEAEGYETAYFVNSFTCGCGTNYKFRLLKKRDKCLPKSPNKPKIELIP